MHVPRPMDQAGLRRSTSFPTSFEVPSMPNSTPLPTEPLDKSGFLLEPRPRFQMEPVVAPPVIQMTGRVPPILGMGPVPGPPAFVSPVGTQMPPQMPPPQVTHIPPMGPVTQMQPQIGPVTQMPPQMGPMIPQQMGPVTQMPPQMPPPVTRMPP